MDNPGESTSPLANQLEYISENSQKQYILRLNKPIELGDKICRTPSGEFKKVHYSVDGVSPTGPLNWQDAYDINQAGTHTSGRRDGLQEFLADGINPFGTPVNEGLAEVPAVVCGYLKHDSVIQDSETLKRNYGDIFNSESEGFVVVLGPEIEKTDGYEVVGLEARIKVKVTTEITKAIIVGNEKMETKVVDALKKRGVTLPVIRLNRVESSL